MWLEKSSFTTGKQRGRESKLHGSIGSIVSGGGDIESGRNDLFTLRIIIENHFSVVFIISKKTFWLWDERQLTAEVGNS